MFSEDYITTETGAGREGDVAILKSPPFRLTQTGCLELRYMLSIADKLDLFYLEGEDSVLRQHICTLAGIDHSIYDETFPPEACVSFRSIYICTSSPSTFSFLQSVSAFPCCRPPGYNFSVDIPAAATNLILIGHSDNDTLSSSIIYNFNLVDTNCMDYFYPRERNFYHSETNVFLIEWNPSNRGRVI